MRSANRGRSRASRLHLASLAFSLILLTGITHATPSGSVRISILSLLKPKHVSVTLISPSLAMLRTPKTEHPINTDNRFEISVEQGSLQALDMHGSEMHLKCRERCTVVLEIGNEMKREYNGDLSFYYKYNTISIILSNNIDDMAISIASSEMRGIQEVEAMKAFAIVIRSFLVNGNRHPSEFADFCDTTHCQVFQNLSANPEIYDAFRKTESLVLFYRNEPLRPFYSKSCGGSTSTFQSVWGKDSSTYNFPSVSCPCKNVDTNWKSFLSTSELSAITGIQKPSLLRTENTIEISQGNFVTPYALEEFRTKVGKTIGWKRIPGNNYELISAANGYHFEGKGRGHGVGFCQTGASMLAAKGFKFDEILSHYFPSTELKSSPQRSEK